MRPADHRLLLARAHPAKHSTPEAEVRWERANCAAQRSPADLQPFPPATSPPNQPAACDGSKGSKPLGLENASCVSPPFPSFRVLSRACVLLASFESSSENLHYRLGFVRCAGRYQQNIIDIRTDSGKCRRPNLTSTPKRLVETASVLKMVL